MRGACDARAETETKNTRFETMKKLAMLVSFALAAGVAFAQEPQPGQPAPKAPEKAYGQAEKAQKNEVTGEVVALDTVKKTITFKSDKGEKTLPAEGAAADVLKDLKTGDKVTISCSVDEKGEPKAATRISKSMKPPAEKQ
jgi:hypothetical protein